LRKVAAKQDLTPDDFDALLVSGPSTSRRTEPAPVDGPSRAPKTGTNSKSKETVELMEVVEERRPSDAMEDFWSFPPDSPPNYAIPRSIDEAPIDPSFRMNPVHVAVTQGQNYSTNGAGFLSDSSLAPPGRHTNRTGCHNSDFSHTGLDSEISVQPVSSPGIAIIPSREATHSHITRNIFVQDRCRRTVFDHSSGCRYTNSSFHG